MSIVPLEEGPRAAPTGTLCAVAAAAVFGSAYGIYERGYEGRREDGDKDYIQRLHMSMPIWYTIAATSHATPHWSMTTPRALSPPPNSRLMVATAATQGV